MNDKDEKNFQETLKWFGAEREDEARFYFMKACEYKQKENEALREQFKKAKEVIEFYADSKNWKFETLLNYENWGGERAEYFLFKLELEGER